MKAHLLQNNRPVIPVSLFSAGNCQLWSINRSSAAGLFFVKKELKSIFTSGFSFLFLIPPPHFIVLTDYSADTCVSNFNFVISFSLLPHHSLRPSFSRFSLPSQLLPSTFVVFPLSSPASSHSQSSADLPAP